MTVEEKRAVVNSYCADKGCGNCVLKNEEWDHETEYNTCLCIEDANEPELDKALELIGVHVEVEPTAQLEQIIEAADTVIKISSKRKLESVTIYFREEV